MERGDGKGPFEGLRKRNHQPNNLKSKTCRGNNREQSPKKRRPKTRRKGRGPFRGEGTLLVTNIPAQREGEMEAKKTNKLLLTGPGKTTT